MFGSIFNVSKFTLPLQPLASPWSAKNQHVEQPGYTGSVNDINNMESIKEICCVIGTSFNRFFPLGLPLLLPGPCFSLPSVDPPRWTPPPLTRILDPGLGLLSLGRRHFSGLGSSGEEDMQNTLLQTQNLHISVLFPSAAEAETNLRQTHY